jgi:hypothetical protein
MATDHRYPGIHFCRARRRRNPAHFLAKNTPPLLNNSYPARLSLQSGPTISATKTSVEMLFESA